MKHHTTRASRREHGPAATHRLRRQHAAQRLHAEQPALSCSSTQQGRHPLAPPPAPITLTPLVAMDADTDAELLWHIARTAPELRRWLVANPSADAELLEFVAQAGGPGVKDAFDVLFDSMDYDVAWRKRTRRRKSPDNR